MRNRYWLWCVMPLDSDIPLLVVLGTRQDVSKRWRELAGRGTRHQPLQVHMMISKHINPKYPMCIRIKPYKEGGFDTRAEAEAVMMTLRLQNNLLFVEDFTGPKKRDWLS